MRRKRIRKAERHREDYNDAIEDVLLALYADNNLTLADAMHYYSMLSIGDEPSSILLEIAKLKEERQ